MARITGFGGVLFLSADPKALAAWYRDKLGLNIEDWGGAMIRADGAGPPHGVWAPFAKNTSYFDPSSREFMINFAVDDMDGFVAALEAKGVEVNGRHEDGIGKFAWILDPDGTKIEFWQPAQQAPAK
jgi:catechol 2,3-dioxygenase-like lactoylglutathione lyase family enzyme